MFAVQDEGVSAAVKCTVSTSGAQSNITGCSQVNSIINFVQSVFKYLTLSVEKLNVWAMTPENPSTGPGPDVIKPFHTPLS